jgi:hypothetical protein
MKEHVMLLLQIKKSGYVLGAIARKRLSAFIGALVLTTVVGIAPASAGGDSDAGSFSIVDMVILQGETVLGNANGASALRRDPRGANATLHLADLQAGVAYSVWALAFNRPNRCQGIPCLPGPDGKNAKLSIFWVASGIAAQGTGGGVLNLSFRMYRGRPSSTVIPAFRQNGLTNVKGAEVHFVVVEHGEAMPGFMAMPMITPGPGIRGAVHLPPSAH